MAKQGPLSGQQVANKYLLGEWLGGGGFGEVYKAEDTTLGHRPVAVKVLNPQGPISPTEIQMFQDEALRLANLKHSNIPHIYERFSEAGHWFLVMEFIEGQTLKDHLEQRGGRLPVQEALQIGLQLAAVLDYLHQQTPPIIFRDLKPANVMISPDGKVSLIDFGIARVFTPGKAQDTFVALSRGYAAPEQHGTAQTTVRSDIYSLGATLHHLLSGTHPASSPFLFAPLPIQQPAQLAPLIAQMVALDPTTRPASMVVVKEALQSLRDLAVAAGPASIPAPAPTLPVTPVLFATTQPLMPSPALAAQPTVPAARNVPLAAAAGCEIPLPDGRICGIPPVGRCVTCGRAFCTSHQAYQRSSYGLVPYVDMCAPCLAKAQANEEKRRQEAQAKYQAKENEAREYIQSGSARIALLTAGVRPVNIYQIGQKEEKIGRNYRTVEAVTSVQHGWVLGPFIWKSTESFTALTALLDQDQVVFLCVVPYQESYMIAGQLEIYRNYSIREYEMPKVAEAIMRLIELNGLGVESIFTRRLPSKYDPLYRGGQGPTGKPGFLRIEDGEEPGRIYEIQKEAFSLGRDKDIDLRMNGTATVMNLGNGNYALKTEGCFGVKINGQELERDSPLYPLREGDRIQARVSVSNPLDQRTYLDSQTVFVFGTK